MVELENDNENKVTEKSESEGDVIVVPKVFTLESE